MVLWRGVAAGYDLWMTQSRNSLTDQNLKRICSNGPWCRTLAFCFREIYSFRIARGSLPGLRCVWLSVAALDPGFCVKLYVRFYIRRELRRVLLAHARRWCLSIQQAAVVLRGHVVLHAAYGRHKENQPAQYHRPPERRDPLAPIVLGVRHVLVAGLGVARVAWCLRTRRLRYLPLATRHSPRACCMVLEDPPPPLLATCHKTLATCHVPLATRHSPLAAHHTPYATCPTSRAKAHAAVYLVHT